MFVYQNANRDICVTFKSGMPVKDPEYVISIDHEKGVIIVNDKEMVPAAPKTEEPENVTPANTEVEDTTEVIEGDTETEVEEPTDPETDTGDDE